MAAMGIGAPTPNIHNQRRVTGRSSNPPGPASYGFPPPPTALCMPLANHSSVAIPSPSPSIISPTVSPTDATPPVVSLPAAPPEGVQLSANLAEYLRQNPNTNRLYNNHGSIRRPACVECHNSRKKCDLERSCTRCLKFNLPCIERPPRGKRKRSDGEIVPPTPTPKAPKTQKRTIRTGLPSPGYEKAPVVKTKPQKPKQQAKVQHNKVETGCHPPPLTSTCTATAITTSNTPYQVTSNEPWMNHNTQPVHPISEPVSPMELDNEPQPPSMDEEAAAQALDHMTDLFPLPAFLFEDIEIPPPVGKYLQSTGRRSSNIPIYGVQDGDIHAILLKQIELDLNMDPLEWAAANGLNISDPAMQNETSVITTQAVAEDSNILMGSKGQNCAIDAQPVSQHNNFNMTSKDQTNMTNTMNTKETQNTNVNFEMGPMQQNLNNTGSEKQNINIDPHQNANNTLDKGLPTTNSEVKLTADIASGPAFDLVDIPDLADFMNNFDSIDMSWAEGNFWDEGFASFPDI